MLMMLMIVVDPIDCPFLCVRVGSEAVMQVGRKTMLLSGSERLVTRRGGACCHPARHKRTHK